MSVPFVSVLMAVRNEAPSIESSLAAVLDQDYAADRMQVLVVDGMSTDKTRDVVMRLAALHPQVEIRILSNPAGIAPVGLNLALLQSRGEIVVRVDGHTVIAPDYVRQCVDALQRTGADNAGGRMMPAGHNAFGRAVALATTSWFGIGGGRFHVSDKEEWVDTVYMGAWRRRVFEKIGLFDEELVRDQDDEFNYRLRQNGGRVLLTPLIRSEYAVRGSPARLWNQYFGYGFWKVRVLQKHPAQMQARQFVPPLFVAALLLSLVVSIAALILRRYEASWLFLAVSGCYLLADVAATMRLRPRNRDGKLLHLPIVFAILHLSYGGGFLAGLFWFWRRWGDRIGKVPAWDEGAAASSEP